MKKDSEMKSLGPSQKKVIEYLEKPWRDFWTPLSEIGEKVGGVDLTGKNTRGTAWACGVIKPLEKEGIIERKKIGKNSVCRLKTK